MIDWVFLVAFLLINFLLFSYFEKRVEKANLTDSIIIGLTTSLTGSYMVYALIEGLTSGTLLLLEPLVTVEAIFLALLVIGNLLEKTQTRPI